VVVAVALESVLLVWRPRASRIIVNVSTVVQLNESPLQLVPLPEHTAVVSEVVPPNSS